MRFFMMIDKSLKYLNNTKNINKTKQPIISNQNNKTVKKIKPAVSSFDKLLKQILSLHHE